MYINIYLSLSQVDVWNNNLKNSPSQRRSRSAIDRFPIVDLDRETEP